MVAMDKRLRFSFVIPAYNEEEYIERTLETILGLAYPKESHEVIVVENGSTDQTLERARAFEAQHVKVIHTDGKGTAHAKNIGANNLHPESDWVIFLDADTTLESGFLVELERFLSSSGESFSVGTTSVLPISGTRTARWWFALHNLGHRLSKSSYSIKIVRRSLFPAVRFDETLTMGEDLHVIAQARVHGEFFFMPTKTVATSTRRFEKVGWWKMAFLWLFVALLPTRLKRRFVYDVVR